MALYHAKSVSHVPAKDCISNNHNIMLCTSWLLGFTYYFHLIIKANYRATV